MPGGLAIGSGFAQGFASVMAPFLERQAQQRAHAKATEETQLSHAILKKVSTLAATPEGSQLLMNNPDFHELGMAIVHGKKFDSDVALQLLTTPDPGIQKNRELFFGEEADGGAGAAAGGAPGTGPSAPAPDTVAQTTPATPRQPKPLPPDTSVSMPLGGGLRGTKHAPSSKERQVDEAKAIVDAAARGNGTPHEEFLRASEGKSVEAVMSAGKMIAHRMFDEMTAQGMSPTAASALITRGGFGSYMSGPYAQQSAIVGALPAKKEIEREFAGPIEAEKQKVLSAYKPADVQRAMGALNIDPEAPRSDVDNARIDAYLNGVGAAKAGAKKRAEIQADVEEKPIADKDRANMFLPDGQPVPFGTTHTDAQKMGVVNLDPQSREQVTALVQVIPIVESYRREASRLFPNEQPEKNALNFRKAQFNRETTSFEALRGRMAPLLRFFREGRFGKFAQDAAQHNFPGLEDESLVRGALRRSQIEQTVKDFNQLIDITLRSKGLQPGKFRRNVEAGMTPFTREDQPAAEGAAAPTTPKTADEYLQQLGQ